MKLAAGLMCSKWAEDSLGVISAVNTLLSSLFRDRRAVRGCAGGGDTQITTNHAWGVMVCSWLRKSHNSTLLYCDMPVTRYVILTFFNFLLFLFSAITMLVLLLLCINWKCDCVLDLT